MQITDEEIELMRAKISRDLGFYDNAGKIRFEMFMLIKKWMVANRLEAFVDKAASPSGVLLAKGSFEKSNELLEAIESGAAFNKGFGLITTVNPLWDHWLDVISKQIEINNKDLGK